MVNVVLWLGYGQATTSFTMMMAPPDPLIGLLGGLTVLLVVLLFAWPERGLWARWRRWRQTSARVYEEDALKHMYKVELQGRRPTLQSLAGTLQVSLAQAAEVLATLQARRWVQVVGQEIRLLPPGRGHALNIVRAHRLWEQHLAEQTGVAEADWHRLAEVREHFLSPTEADELSARLGHPAYDPHGDPIPTASGEVAPGGGQPLATLAPEDWGVVLHVEDEPESVYAQIRAIGLYPGTVLRMVESSDRRVRIWAEGEEHVLAPVVAANVSVRAVQSNLRESEAGTVALSSLTVGQRGVVAQLARQCRGAERRRLLDLGLLPGTSVVAEMVSPGGNLTAYRVRDALIALRREQAASIRVKMEGGTP